MTAMASAATFARSLASTTSTFAFERDTAVTAGRSLRPAFVSARPFAHVVVDGFLGPSLAAAVAAAFPPATHPGWKRRDYAEQSGRLSQLQRTGFADVAPALRQLLLELGGMAFLDFLGALTERDDLIADPHFRGAGLFATLPGGHLALHADFNRDRTRRLDRVLSALYYAPPSWEPAWGGDLELWNRDRTACEARIAVKPDRLVILAYGEENFHGHPAPLACPAGHVRAVVAAHYYAAPPRDDDGAAHGARWVEPAGEP